MDYEELVNEYLDIITIIIEAVGQKLNNKKYQQASRLIKENRANIDKSIENEDEFYIIITHVIISLLIDIHDISNLSGRENVVKLNTLIDDFFNRYLKEPTNKFLKKNGMKPVQQPSAYGTSLILEKNGYGKRE